MSTGTENLPVAKIENRTAKRLTIRGDDDRILVLSPFEKNRELSADTHKNFPGLNRLQMLNLVKVLDERGPGPWEPQIKMLASATISLTFAVFYIGHQILTDGGKVPLDPKWSYRGKIGLPVFPIVTLLVGLGILYLIRRGDRGRTFFQKVNRWVAQALSLLVIVTIAMVLPILAFYILGEGRELLGSSNSLAKLGRALQLVFIFSASLLPALLYYLFDRQQLGTLRQKFEQQIFRLDPNIETICDVRAKYGRQIDEIYGQETTAGEGRLTRGTRWPILVATLVITVGWMLTLLPAAPTAEMSSPSQLIEFFMPQKSVVTFGFLGAYFFVLNMVLHRYVRADLKPKAYSSITVRILIVIILAWVIGLPFHPHNSYALMLVFLVGVFPESGLTLIRESIRNQRGLGRLAGVFGPRTREKYPLTDLEELDVYDRARLLDEGVTNIESLAHHDLIDLMLETRIPVPRLVDWIDQAVLYLHLGPEDENDSKPPEESRKRRRKQRLPNPNGGESANHPTPTVEPKVTVAGPRHVPLREWLRKNSVRTATDFLGAYDSKTKSLRSKAEADKRTAELDVLLETLEDDEWLDYVHHWRVSSRIESASLDASSAADQHPTRVKVQLKGLNGQPEVYEAEFVIDEANADSLVPAPELEKRGIKPIGKTAYLLPDGTVCEYPFGLAEISFMSETTAGRVIFGPEDNQPVLGVTARASVGISVRPTGYGLKRAPVSDAK